MSLSSTMSQFPARRHFPRFIRPRERGAEQERHQDRAAEAGPDRGRDIAGSARQPFPRSFFLAPTTGRKRSPSPAHSPRLCAALSPTRSADNGCVRRMSPSAKAEFLARQIRRPSPSSACAAALRVQAARAGLFCAAPRGTRWRWASGPRRKKEVLQNGFQPLQVLPQA